MDIASINKRLAEFRNKNFTKIYTIADMIDEYKNKYIPNMDTTRINLGVPTLDIALEGIEPSQVVTIIAPTNVGKTSMLLNIALNNSPAMKDKIIPIFECEIPAKEILERFIQIEHDVYTYEVKEAFKNKSDKSLEFEKLAGKYPNILGIIERIDIDDIVPFCLACQEISGKQLGFIGIDYLGLIKSSKFRNEYDRVTHVMTSLKEIALHLDIPVLTFAQPSRPDLKEGKDINLYSGKSSGEIENSSQILITLNKIDETNILKQNKLELSLQIKDLIAEEKIYLLKAKIEKKKQGKYASTYLIYNTRSTKITEYKPEELY